MTFRKNVLWWSFTFSFLLMVTAPLAVPYMRLFSFAPYLTLALLLVNAPLLLYIGAGCGLIVDLFSPGSPFGLSALIYTLIVLIACRYRNYVSLDKPQGPLMLCTYLSLLYTIATFLFSAFIGTPIPLTKNTFLTNFLILPFIDGVVGFGTCFYPVALYSSIKSAEELPLWAQFLLRFGQKMLKNKS